MHFLWLVSAFNLVILANVSKCLNITVQEFCSTVFFYKKKKSSKTHKFVTMQVSIRFYGHLSAS